jgi:hypothetical protein
VICIEGRVDNPAAVEITLTITMKTSEWERIVGLMDASRSIKGFSDDSCEFRNTVAAVVAKVRQRIMENLTPELVASDGGTT